jgi:hypothetical protein
MKKTLLFITVVQMSLLALAILPAKVRSASFEFQFEPLIESPAEDQLSFFLQDATSRVWVFFTSTRADGGHSHIFYNTSIDGGTSWSEASLFSPAFVLGLDMLDPVAFQDSAHTIWVAWRNHTAPYDADQVWFTTSGDGENWAPARQLCDGHNDMGGFIEAEGKVWFFFAPLSNYWRVSYKTTTDQGKTWSDSTPITADGGMRNPYPIFLSNGTIFVVYRIGAYHFEANIGYSSSSDGGLTWSTGVVDDPSYPQWDSNPRATEYRGNIFVFFQHGYEQATTDHIDVWFRVWNGTDWEEPQQLTNDIYIKGNPAPICMYNCIWVAFDTNKAGTWDIWLAKIHYCLVSTVDIDPDTLNLKSKGKWITAYIELPKGYDVADINVSTIAMNDTVRAELTPTSVGDYGSDGLPSLMVKFDRVAVVQCILNNVPNTDKSVVLTITGKLDDGTLLQGSGTIRIIH